MTAKAVTTAQVEQMRKMSVDKGVCRDAFQLGLDGGIFARALDEAKTRFANGGLLVPDGGRIHLLSGILVRGDEDWKEALEAAGPQTPENYIIRQVGHLYPPSGKGDVRKNFVLLNRPGWSLDQFLVWGKANQLKGTTARDVFAVGREKPGLNAELRMDPMWVHATDAKPFGGSRCVPGVWWGGAGRGAGRSLVEGVGDALGWCLLSRE